MRGAALDFSEGGLNWNSSTIRILSQLIPGIPELPSLLPSIAETLSVLQCSMLIKSAINATFYYYRPYPATTLNPGIYEMFNASIRMQQYASGPVLGWEGIFYPVLLLMFLGNAFCLVYLILHMHLYSDLTDPQTSFALTMNSPYSRELQGSCGTVPTGKQLAVVLVFETRQKQTLLSRCTKRPKLSRRYPAFKEA